MRPSGPTSGAPATPIVRTATLGAAPRSENRSISIAPLASLITSSVESFSQAGL